MLLFSVFSYVILNLCVIIFAIMKGIKINKTLRNLLIGLAAILVLVAVFSLIPDKDFSEKYEGFDLSSNVGVTSSTKTYSEYLADFNDAKNPSVTVDVDIFNFDKSKSYGTRIEKDYHGKDVVFTEDRSSVTWSVSALF